MALTAGTAPAWTGPTAIDPGVQLDSVDCTSSAFCVAADHQGNVFFYDGTNWTGADDIDGNAAINSVSCTSTAFCVAVDAQGNALTYGRIFVVDAHHRSGIHFLCVLRDDPPSAWP